MTIRQTIQRWHGGQLVIAWIGLVIVTAMLTALCWVAMTVIAGKRDQLVTETASRLILASPEQLARARLVTPLDFNGYPKSDYSYQTDLMKEANRIAREDTLSAINQHYQGYVDFPLYVALILPLITLVLGLVGTWWWCGSRVPTTSTPTQSE